MMTSPTMFQNTFNELFAGIILWSLENVILKVLLNIFVFEKTNNINLVCVNG